MYYLNNQEFLQKPSFSLFWLHGMIECGMWTKSIWNYGYSWREDHYGLIIYKGIPLKLVDPVLGCITIIIHTVITMYH